MKHSMITLLAVSAVALASCQGDDGTNGSAGAPGAVGEQGIQGEQGETGLSTLTTHTNLASGEESCAMGGVKIESGLDTDKSGALESSEITDTSVVCLPVEEKSMVNLKDNTLENTWYQSGERTLEETISHMTQTGQAKNVILFVGDGMGISTVTASRILEGQLRGELGEENQLSFDQFPFVGLAKTYNVDAQTPDSAGTMTAMVSGVKTDIGVLGVDENIVRGDCSSVAGNELVTALELAEIAGKSTGIISTARITHATPASNYAKSADRNWEDNSDMTTDAVTAGCVDVATQLVEFEQNLEAKFNVDVDGIEVVMGGGRRHFLPKDAAFNSNDAVSSVEGDRTDARDLTAQWQSDYTNGIYVTDRVGFDAIDPENTERVFGLFNESHMQYEADRKNDIAGEPSLAQMTQKAIGILDNNEEGFFLSVEAGRIDHAHHAGNAYNALVDTIALSDAVRMARSLTSEDDTLIIVTADHGHVFTIAGYPKRGNPILGKVVNVGSESYALAADGMPYTTVGYTNGKGMMDLGMQTDADAGYAEPTNAGRQNLLLVDTQAPGFHQEALVPLSSETHAGEDVGIYASGPGASLVTGTNEQQTIFHIMNFAADLVTKADAKIDAANPAP